MEKRIMKKNNIIAHYDSIIWSGKWISDKYTNTIIDTTIYLAQEIIIMAISWGLGAVAERALVWVATKVFEWMNAGRKFIAAAEASWLSWIELARVGVQWGKYVDKLAKAGRVVNATEVTVDMTRKIWGIASFLSKWSFITKESLEIAQTAKWLTTMIKLWRYATNGTIFHLSSQWMNNIIEGQDISTHMWLVDFAKSIAFIGVLSEISSVFRMALPLNNPKAAEKILNTPQKTAGQNIVINTGNFLKEASKVGAELSTEVAALLWTSRVVNFIFGEGSPDMTPNEIAHTIAIVLGMKAFHGIVTIKDKNTIIYENKEIKLEDGFKIWDRVRSKSGKEWTAIEWTQNWRSIVKYDKWWKAFTKNENLTKIKNKNNQGNYMTQSNNKKTSEELWSENKILREKKNDLNNQKKKLEQELSEYENANKKYGLEKWTQPPKWDKELLDHNLDDMIGWLNKKLEWKTQQEIRDNGQLWEYSYILELFTGYKDSKTERNANKILDKLNVLEHYTEQWSLVKIDKSSEIQEKIKEINQEIKDIDTQRAINIVEKKNIYDQQKEVKIWSKKQFETYKESINQASEKVKDLWEGLVGPLSKLKDIENFTREDIKAIQSGMGMTGKEIDGILWPKTLIKLEEYVNKQRESLKQENIKPKSERVSEEQIKQESKEIEEGLKKEEVFDKVEKLVDRYDKINDILIELYGNNRE